MKKKSVNALTITYRFRLEPTPWQRILFNRYAGSCRYVYNYCLELFKTAFQNKIILSYQDLCKELTLLKLRPGLEWLSEPHSQALQQSIKDLSNATARFLWPDSSGKKLGFPRFKKRGSKDSFRYPQGTKIKDNKVFLPKIGYVKFRASRNIEGTIAQATVKREGNHWFVTLVCHQNKAIPAIVPPKNILGIDMGINHLAVLSTGEYIENPQWLKNSLKELAIEQKSLSRKEKRSNNYKKQVQKVVQIHIDIKNMRKDYLHKLSTRLIKNHDAFAIEDLNISGMIQNRKLSRSIADASWNILISMLMYKAQWVGKQVIKLDRFLPSSKICSSCQAKQDMPLNIRTYSCSACGLILDRDLNASLNIRAAGHSVLNTCGAISIG